MLSPSLIVTWFCFPVSLPSQEDAQEESGWKQVHGDVFRPPRKGMLLSVFLGQGTQIFIMTFITLCKDYFTLGYYLLYTRIRVSFLLTSISSFFFFSLCVSHIKYITKWHQCHTFFAHTNKWFRFSCSQYCTKWMPCCSLSSFFFLFLWVSRIQVKLFP